MRGFIRKRRWYYWLLVGLVMGALGGHFSSEVRAQEERVAVHVFFSKACPHCSAEREYLELLSEKYKWMDLSEYEVSSSVANSLLFSSTAKKLSADTSGVPFTVVCDEYFVGYSESFDEGIEALVLRKRENGCRDIVSQEPVETPRPTMEPLPSSLSNNQVPETFSVPFWGEVDWRGLSLPVLTFLVALLDGFNPCAMWTLLFLISLLLGVRERVKMWTLGSLFIFTSGAVYFLFLAAWLQVFLLVGFVIYVRVLVGLFAMGVGAYYLWDFLVNKKAVCKVTNDERRRAVFARLREIVLQRNFLISVVGIMLLAVAVNMVELVCSAGLPAIYTQILSMSGVSSWQRYLYLIFYILVFMMDDIFVFFVAMVTLRSTALSNKYAHMSHLVGGVLMFIIGILLLFRPEALMFG